MHKKHNGYLTMLAAMFLILLLAGPAAAVVIKSGDMVSVPNGTIKGPLFTSGNNIIINADVDGDVFAAGQSIVINGKVDGDVIAAANTVRVNGHVQGDLRAAANTIEISGQIDGSITGAANNIGIREGSNVKRDVLLFGSTAELFAPIEGQVMGAVNQMHLNSSINGDVQIWDVQNLVVGSSAVVRGKLNYRSDNTAQISSEAKLGEVTRLTPRVRPDNKESKEGVSWFAGLLWITTGVLIWGVAYLMFPALLPRVGKVAKDEPWSTLGWGFLAIMLIPLSALLLMITVVGIPLALLFLLVYVIVLLIAKIIAADFLARCLTNYLKWEGRIPFILPFMMAFIALIMLERIPILGFIINLIAASLALGMLVLTFYRWRLKSPEVQN